MKKLHLCSISWGMAIVVLCLLAHRPSGAEDIRLMSVGVRAGFSGGSPIGEPEAEHFQQYDVMAIFGLPWEWYAQSGWGIGTRLQVSAGAFRAAGTTGFIGTFMPAIALGKKDGWFSIEGGGGAALLSDYQFGDQNLGGPFQFVWNIGVRTAVYQAFGVGYWFQHLSDATIYGDEKRGVDMHMVDLTYRY